MAAQNSDFDRAFRAWLDRALSEQIPADVEGFHFNLYEPAGEQGVKFGVEIIGAGTFSSEDPDWPCDEVWEPVERCLLIPLEYSGQEWEGCLEGMKGLASRYLASETPGSQRLKSVRGVGIGFVDGDTETLWQDRQTRDEGSSSDSSAAGKANDASEGRPADAAKPWWKLW